MGRDKALLPWPPNSSPERRTPTPVISEGRVAAPPPAETFLSGAIHLLNHFTEQVLVIAGKNADAIAPIVYSTSAALVVNRHPERGQFSSLQAGLQEVLNRGRDSAIITLVDRPPCTPDTLRTLINTFRDTGEAQDKWAVVPEFEGKHGHPIVAGREMIEAFLKAPAAANARDVEHSVQPHIQYVPVNDPWVIANVDTPAQYERLQQP